MISIKVMDAVAMDTLSTDMSVFEKSFTYPLGDDGCFFRIDHGEYYSRFFSRMGDAFFIVAKNGNEIIGCMALVYKPVVIDGCSREAIYICDLKVKAAYRDGRLTSKLFLKAAWFMLKKGFLLKRPFVYCIMMEGKKGHYTGHPDKRFNLMKLLRPFALFDIYFMSQPQALHLATQPIMADGFAVRGGSYLTPSDDAGQGSIALHGIKDIVILPDAQAMKLRHLCHHYQAGRSSSLLLNIINQGQSIAADEVLCFAIDRRQTLLRAWLERSGLKPEGEAFAYGVFWQTLRSALPIWVGTDEI